jgi:hypothetical protein
MFDMLWAMVKHALPHLSSDGILEVLSKRLQVEASYTPAFFSDPMVQEAFGEEDAKVLNEHIKVAKDKAVELKQFKESFTAKSKALRGGAGAAGGKRGRGRGRGRGTGESNSSSSSQAQRLAPQLDVHEFSVEEARSWLPAGRASLSKDLVNGRWLVVAKGVGSRSRSFQLYTERKALAICLKYVWVSCEVFSGQPCPHQWIIEEGDEAE